jgi:hypothetical protein
MEEQMPTRILREGIISSERVNSLSERAELFYRKLMSVADDYGRFFANPISVLGACYPLRSDVSEADVKQFLNECISAKLIAIYGAGKYLVILDFNQQTRSKSKFPDPTDKELLIKCKSNVNQMSSLVVGGGEAVGVVESEADCISQTMNVGIPEGFTKFVYQDWSSRSGKDAGGVLVKFLPYVTKRWSRESVEWRNGKHKGAPASERPVGGNF